MVNPVVLKCPICQAGQLYRRVSKAPAFRCQRCGWEGDEPIMETRVVAFAKTCPNCKSIHLKRLTRNTAHGRYCCTSCGWRGNDPIRREVYRPWPSTQNQENDKKCPTLQ